MYLKKEMTSTAFLSNIAPGRGDVNSSPPFSFQSSIGIKRNYASLPSVAALQNPSLHNRVPEPSVNSTARAPIFARPFKREFEKRYAEGDLLFVQEDGRAANGNQNVVMNLPVLNYSLKTQTRAGGGLRYQSLDDILWGDQAIHYYGIMNNDMDTGSKWQRLLNVNVRGRSRVARLWQPDLGAGQLKRGQILYLGLFKRREETVQSKSFEDPNGARYPLDGGLEYYEARAILECCDDARDPNAFSKAEHVIPVGVVSQVSMRKPSKSSIDRAHQTSEACKTLERIEVLMRI